MSGSSSKQDGFRLTGDEIQRMRQLRWSKGLSIDSCAAALNIETRDYLLKELGRERFSMEELSALATLLGAPPSSLIGKVFLERVG